MRRIHYLLCVLALLAGCLIGQLLFNHFETNRPRVMMDSVTSTCVIQTASTRMGTGFLLETGYVVTAAHVVDLDRDGVLTSDERDVVTKFGHREYPGRVATFNLLYDFAIIEGSFPKYPYPLRFAERDVPVTERIYTVGATESRPFMISEGIVSMPEVTRGRASCFISSGNSGGGIFNSNHEVVGMAVSMGTRLQVDVLRIPVPYQGQVIVIEGTLARRTPLHSMCAYTRVDDIRKTLADKQLGLFVDLPEELPLYERITPWTFGVIKTVIHLSILLVFLWFFRKHI